MDRFPLVTVAMVTYNSEKYVSAAIESVLSSSYPHFELIICDDNSSDNTWEIVDSYTDKRIKARRNKENLGEYSNRNQCIDLATGEYLLFIDGDDMIYPHGLEFMTRMLDAFPDCSMALMRWYKKNVFYPAKISPRQFYTGVFFHYGFNDIAFTNTFFRTSTLREAGEFPKNIKAGDEYIRLVLGAKFNTLLINDHLTFWRETPGQASSILYKNYVGIIEHFELYLNSLNHCPLSSIEVEEAQNNLKIEIARVCMQLVKKGQLGNAGKLLRHYNFSVRDILWFFRKAKYKDPFEEYTPSSLYQLPFSKNPYSRKWENSKNDAEARTAIKESR